MTENTNNTYSTQRVLNMGKLEERYNSILEEYLVEYEKYLTLTSRHISGGNVDESETEAVKERVLELNNSLLGIIQQLYRSIEKADNNFTETKTKNSEKREIMINNQKTLVHQRKMIMENHISLLTKEERLKQMESIYSDKNRKFRGILIADIVIGLILCVLLAFALGGVQYINRKFRRQAGRMGMRPGMGRYR